MLRRTLASVVSLALAASALVAATPARAGATLTLYSSAPEAVTRPLVEAFEKQSGTKVVLVAPKKDGKTDGASALAARIRAEQAAPQADVFWDSEGLETVALAGEGRLAAHSGAIAGSLPERWRDAEGRWHAVALRERVLVYPTGHVPNVGSEKQQKTPSTMRELWHPLLSKGVFVMARPFEGSLRYNVAALGALWGKEGARTWAEQMATQRARLLANEGAVVGAVLRLEALAGLTDSDQVWAAKARGEQVEMSRLTHDKYSIRNEVEERHGALLIPHVVAVIRGAPHGADAGAFVDFLLSEDGQRMLATGAHRLCPTRPEIAAKFPELVVEGPAEARVEDVAKALPEAMKAYDEVFPE